MKKGLNILAILGVVLFSGCGTASDDYNQMESGVIRSKNDTVPSVQNDDTKANEVKNEDESDKRPFVMFEGCPQRDVDIASFQALNNSYAKDKNNVYWLGRPGCDLLKLEGGDPKTFVVVNSFFGKDKNFVYTGDRKIEGADVKTFTIAKLSNIPQGMCGQDKSGYYSALHLTEDTNGNPIDEKCAQENKGEEINLKTYQSKELGISFQYPTTLGKVWENKSQGTEIVGIKFLDGKGNPADLDLAGANYGTLRTCKDIMSKGFADGDKIPSNCETLTVDNHSVVILTYVQGGRSNGYTNDSKEVHFQTKKGVWAFSARNKEQYDNLMSIVKTLKYIQ